MVCNLNLQLLKKELLSLLTLCWFISIESPILQSDITLLHKRMAFALLTSTCEEECALPSALNLPFVHLIRVISRLNILYKYHKDNG